MKVILKCSFLTGGEILYTKQMTPTRAGMVKQIEELSSPKEERLLKQVFTYG